MIHYVMWVNKSSHGEFEKDLKFFDFNNYLCLYLDAAQQKEFMALISNPSTSIESK